MFDVYEVSGRSNGEPETGVRLPSDAIVSAVTASRTREVVSTRKLPVGLICGPVNVPKSLEPVRERLPFAFMENESIGVPGALFAKRQWPEGSSASGQGPE